MGMGTLIRQAREKAGIAQCSVARQLGVSNMFFCRIEAQTKRLPIARWTRLVEILPSLTLTDLAQAHMDGGPVEINPSRLTSLARAQLEELLLIDATMAHHATTKSAA
jgi:transcriptional regulator with XRE-family HTH domain